jgi:transcriptional regulator with XRE-family HTH domain
MYSAEIVKELRVKMGLNRADFAKKLGLTRTSVYHYENGLRMPKQQILRLILILAKKNKLDINLEKLMGV